MCSCAEEMFDPYCCCCSTMKVNLCKQLSQFLLKHTKQALGSILYGIEESGKRHNPKTDTGI